MRNNFFNNQSHDKSLSLGILIVSFFCFPFTKLKKKRWNRVISLTSTRFRKKEYK